MVNDKHPVQCAKFIAPYESREQECAQLRNLLLEGVQSKVSGLADKNYFSALRSSIKNRLLKEK